MKALLLPLSLLLLSSCGIGGVWIEPSNRPIPQYSAKDYPAENYLKNWDKPGATPEQKLKDALTCDSQFLSYTSGSGLDVPFLSSPSEWCQKDAFYCFLGREQIRVRFDGCFLKKGYTYTGWKNCNYTHESSPICDEERGMPYCQKYPKNDNLCPPP